jgi:hypothetical protein
MRRIDSAELLRRIHRVDALGARGANGGSRSSPRSPSGTRSGRRSSIWASRRQVIHGAQITSSNLLQIHHKPVNISP